jgi:hypothetical protein
MEAICFSETSVDFQRTTRRYVPQDGILGSVPAASETRSDSIPDCTRNILYLYCRYKDFLKLFRFLLLPYIMGVV